MALEGYPDQPYAYWTDYTSILASHICITPECWAGLPVS